MVLEYFTAKKPKRDSTVKAESPRSPILTDEDEAFLHRITSGEPDGPSSAREVVLIDTSAVPRSNDAQTALMDGADQVPLPVSPPVAPESETAAKELGSSQQDKKKDNGKRRSKYLSFLPNIGKFNLIKDQSRKKAADDLHNVASAVKTGETPQGLGSEESKKEDEQLNSILDQLNLSAWDNRVFSISQESQKLMDDFTQILKDIVNGVPTAYDDLEQLITSSESQLSSMFDNLPPFMQKFIKTLPAKMGISIAPGLLAAGSEKPGHDGVSIGIVPDQKIRRTIPNLKTLITQQGAAVGMLRTILNFLRLRFPAFISGTNILLSLAVFVLLFVFWYCYKRGRETRLEKERLAAGDREIDEIEATASEIDDSMILGIDGASDAEAERLQALLNKPDPKHVPLPAGHDKDLEESGQASK